MLGASLIIVGAILLAAKGLFDKALYSQGMTYHEVAGIRSVLAIPGFILVAVISARHRRAAQPAPVTGLQMAGAAAAGLWCYYLGALANFYALTLIQANVERALLFSYPAIVVFITAVVTRSLPSLATLIALAATTAGVVLVTGAADAALSAEQWRGVVWVMFCSITIATYFIASGRLTRTMSAASFTLSAMLAAGIAFFLHMGLLLDQWTLALPSESLLTMAGLVIFATVLPLFCVAEGIRRIGASRGALLSTVGPPATAVMAYFLYGERLSAFQLLGTVLVVGSIALLEWQASQRRTSPG